MSGDDLAAHGRIALVGLMMNRAIVEVAAADPDLTYGELVEALAGLTYRYAQHLRLSDDTRVALPAVAAHIGDEYAGTAPTPAGGPRPPVDTSWLSFEQTGRPG